MTKKQLAIASLLCVAAFSATAENNAVSNEIETAGDSICRRMRNSVSDNWSKIAKWCDKATALREELPSLPRSSWFFSDQDSQKERIHDCLMEVRSILLSTDSQKIMEKVDAIDAQTEKLDAEIRELNEERVLHPDKKEKLDGKIAKLREKRNALASEREIAAAKVLKELESLGLKLSGGAAEKCLFTVNVGDLIDNAIVAKNIGSVVENLRELMTTGDVAAAKRYFGMYVVMVEVQKACFDEYLEKSRHGEWREKLAQVTKDAASARAKALEAAKDKSFTSQQRDVFKRNAEVNLATLNAVSQYEKILDQHEAIIQTKSDQAAKMLFVAQNSYDTVSLAMDFLSLVKSTEDSFDALLQLQLPPIEIFDDSSLQTEFTALTKRLKE